MTAEIALLPCPFCRMGLDMQKTMIFNGNIDDVFHHPVNDCYLSGIMVQKGDINSWNRRAGIELDEPGLWG